MHKTVIRYYVSDSFSIQLKIGEHEKLKIKFYWHSGSEVKGFKVPGLCKDTWTENVIGTTGGYTYFDRPTNEYGNKSQAIRNNHLRVIFCCVQSKPRSLGEAKKYMDEYFDQYELSLHQFLIDEAVITVILRTLRPWILRLPHYLQIARRLAQQKLFRPLQINFSDLTCSNRK